jgi:hypothetical protein
MQHRTVQVFDTLTSDGDSIVLDVSNNGKQEYFFQVLGTFDSVTVTVHGSLDGTNFSALISEEGDAVDMTSTRLRPFVFRGQKLKLVAAGGGGSLDIDAWIAH